MQLKQAQQAIVTSQAFYNSLKLTDAHKLTCEAPSQAAAEYLGLVDMGGITLHVLSSMPGSQWMPTNAVAFVGEGIEDLTKLKQFSGDPPKMAYKETIVTSKSSE